MFRLAPSIESALTFAIVNVGVAGKNGVISRTTSSERRYPCVAPPSFATVIVLIFPLSPNAAWNAGSGTNRFSPSFHAPRPSSLTISLTVTGIWTNPRGVPRLTTRPWPTFASTEVARFALMIASVPLRPEPFHVEPSDRTKLPRSRAASKPMTVAVGSNSWLDVSTTAPGSWYRGATRSTVGMLPRFDVRLSYTWAENGRRPPSGDATYTISSTASRARKTAARTVKSNVVWMTRDELMIAVPIKRPATTIATWVFRRKKFPAPIRSGKRFRPAHARTTRHTTPTTMSRVGTSAIGATSGGRRPERLEDRPVSHQDDALHLISNGAVVGDDDECEPFLLVQPFHEFHDLVRGFRVQVPRRLVREDDVRLIDEGAGDGDPLLLTAGKLRGLLRGFVIEAHCGEGLAGPAACSLRVIATNEERELDVFDAPQHGKEVVVLEDESHLHRA